MAWHRSQGLLPFTPYLYELVTSSVASLGEPGRLRFPGRHAGLGWRPAYQGSVRGSVAEVSTEAVSSCNMCLEAAQKRRKIYCIGLIIVFEVLYREERKYVKGTM